MLVKRQLNPSGVIPKLITTGRLLDKYQYQPNINDSVTKYRGEWGNACHSTPTKLIFGLEKFGSVS